LIPAISLESASIKDDAILSLIRTNRPVVKVAAMRLYYLGARIVQVPESHLHFSGSEPLLHLMYASLHTRMDVPKAPHAFCPMSGADSSNVIILCAS
jgi:hypothetical protein